MTVGHPIALKTARSGLVARHADAITTFTAIGWSTDQWVDLHQHFTALELDTDARAVAYWLEDPPGELLTRLTPITPAMVRDLFARHSQRTATVLNSLASGISERFTLAFPDRGWLTNSDVRDGWQDAANFGLVEPHAVGWALTGYLGPVSGHTTLRNPPAFSVLSRHQMLDQVRTWIAQFGPSAYLYVMAGLDLNEVVAMRATGTSPTVQQLRVMVALAGVELPAGV